MQKLTEKQKRFANYYIETGNATESYKKAGYKNYNSNGVEANKTLNNPKIKAYIEEILKNKDKKRIASQDEVLELLTTIARGEMQEESFAVVGGIEGSYIEKVKTQVKPKDRLKAAEMLAKRYGLDKPKSVLQDNNIEIEMVDADED